MAEVVTIQVELPRDEFERVEQQAHREHRAVSEMFPALIEDGLLSRMSSREIMEQVATSYLARLPESGQRELTSDELLEKLRLDRDEIVNERYP